MQALNPPVSFHLKIRRSLNNFLTMPNNNYNYGADYIMNSPNTSVDDQMGSQPVVS